MNEVKKVHLGRQQFTISVDAHRDLRDYLAAIEKQPGVQPEVAKEVEMRMAELLTERGISADKVVLQEDVDFLKQQLGEPRDFKDEDSETDADDNRSKENGTEEADQPKRLFRDTQNGLLAGVASGLAAYMGIDVIIIRIAFVALTFASGAGVLIYILIWLLAPEAKTPRERLQMQGKAVTVDALKEIVDRADIAGASQRVGRNFGSFVTKVVMGIASVILWIIGLGFVTAGIVTMLWSLACGVYLLIHGGQVATEIAFPLGSREVWFVVLASLTGAIVGFFLLIIGLAMVIRKWLLKGWAVAALLGIFLVAGGVGTALGFDTVPHVRDRFRAAHTTQSREVSEFNKLVVRGKEARVVFVPDTKYYVELSYVGKVDSKPLLTTVTDKQLTVDSGEFTKKPLCTGICLYSDYDLEITVHAPTLESVALEGKENSFTIDRQLNQQDLTLQVQRGSEDRVQFNYLSATSAKVTNDERQNWTVELRGIKPNGVPMQNVFVSDDENTIRLNAIDRFELATSAACDEAEPLVYLSDPLQEVKINDKVIQNMNDLRSLRSVDSKTAENCVVIR